MHASRGMDEKWLIIYQKMTEIGGLILALFPTLLGGFPPFSWRLLHFHFFRWLLYFDIVISNKYVHFHHYFFLAHVLFDTWVFVICMLPLTIFAQLFSSLYFVIFLWDRYDVAFNQNSIFDRFKLSLIVQWETIWDTEASGWPPCLHVEIKEE